MSPALRPIIIFYLLGVPVKAIADRFGVTTQFVSKIANAKGYRRHKKRRKS